MQEDVVRLSALFVYLQCKPHISLFHTFRPAHLNSKLFN